MDKISLRPITMEDTSLILKWRNNTSVRNNFIFQDELTKEMHEKWYREKVQTGKVAQFIIIENNTKRPVGSIYFRDIDYDKKSAEYGIFIGEDDARGKGYGSEAAKKALAYAFSKLELTKIILRVYEDNISAIKSYESAGFKLVSGKDENENGKKVIFMQIERTRE